MRGRRAQNMPCSSWTRDLGSLAGRQVRWEEEWHRICPIPWGLWTRDLGSLAGKQVTHLFFHLVQVVRVSLGAVGLAGDV